MRILGIDFTSAPRVRKPITAACGSLRDGVLAIESVDHLVDFEAFERLLRMPGPWIGGFDFPFGLPRELVIALGWPTRWPALIRHYAALPRETVASAFAAFRATRATGNKYAHRAGDIASGAHSSMKLVNPPVAWMLHRGAPRLLDAGLHVPALHDGDRSRVALEAYPGFVMRSIARAAGAKRAPSYKNDAQGKQTAAQREARAWLFERLAQGQALDIPVTAPPALARAAILDATGDTLDAIAAAVQAAWAARRADARYGIPPHADPLEGWIVGC